jgi:GTP-binding protein Era
MSEKDSQNEAELVQAHKKGSSTATEAAANSGKKSGVVVLLGRPNVGKSTFLNAVLKDEISIVTPKAQTTRDQIRGIVTDERGQLVFIDTPGVHRALEGGINAYMIQEVVRALDEPDVVLYLIDPWSKPTAEQVLLDYLKHSKTKVIVVINKVDFKKQKPLIFDWIPAWIEEVKAQLVGTRCEFVSSVEISAAREKGVKELLAQVFDLAPVGPPMYEDPDALTDRPLRFVVSELIRKQLFLNLGDELPYSCAVEIEKYAEDKKPVVIEAMIYVERDSQKGMVIGAGGKKIKEIGTGAREEIEKLIGEKVFLELRVKVMEGWTSESRKMKNLGYALESSHSGKSKRPSGRRV